MTATPNTYAAAGVDIAAGDAAVELIQPHLARTSRGGMVPLLGAFAAGIELPLDRFREPVLVTSVDGVGTKLAIACAAGRLEGIGIDAVAMCVNDMAVTGGVPLVFLDYIATGNLRPEEVAQVVASIADGCEIAGCALVGGETAEMPGTYLPGALDVAGFAVGLAERANLLRADSVRAGDVLIGLASSGLHSNGYSLVRAVLAAAGIEPTGALLDKLLEPTRIYCDALQQLGAYADIDLHAAAHITGGGLPGNVARVIPAGLTARIELGSWPVPQIFDTLQQLGTITDSEMFHVFNMGLGIVLAVPAEQADRTIAFANELGESAFMVGAVNTDDSALGDCRFELVGKGE